MFFKSLSTMSGNFHSGWPEPFRVFHFLFNECGKHWKEEESTAENCGIWLDCRKNTWMKLEKRDGLYAFRKVKPFCEK